MGASGKLGQIQSSTGGYGNVVEDNGRAAGLVLDGRSGISESAASAGANDGASKGS